MHRGQQILHRLGRSFERRIEWMQDNKSLMVCGIGVGAVCAYAYQQTRGVAVSNNSDQTFTVRNEAGGKRTGIVSSGDLAAREETWKLRNIERNHSIMTQDYHRQLDDPKYRKERLKDNDYLRYTRKEE